MKKKKKKNSARAMTTAKNNVFIGLLHENGYLVGEINFWQGEDKNLVRRKSNAGRIFPGGGMSKFQTGGWSPPSRENPVILYIKAIKKKTLFTFLKIYKN